MVRAYRACTTSAEERALVKKESAHIRDLFREGDKAFRRQNIAKLLFFHMNGYPTSFGMTECIKLCASPKYADKRVAYLGLMILVDETEDILMLMTNCLKQDLLTTDRSIVSLALTVLADIASADMVRDLLPEIAQHLTSPDPHLRKKAAVAAVRAVRKLERDEIEDIIVALPQALDGSIPSTLVSGAALITELAKKYPNEKPQFADAAFAPLCAALRQLLLSGGRAADTTVSGVRSPFLTVKLLGALRAIAGPPQAEAFAALINQVASSTPDTHVIGCAVLLECVRGAVAIPQDATLRETTVRILGQFLAHKLASVRYTALQELVKVCALPEVGKHVGEFRDTILACLKESDPTVSQIAVELVYAIATEKDAPEMAAHLLKYLDGDHPVHHQEETCYKLFDLLMRFGGSATLKVDTFVTALELVDLAMPENLITAFAAMISEDPDAQRHAVNALYRVALAGKSESSDTVNEVGSMISAKRKGANRRKPRLERLAIYIIGEYGDLVLANAPETEAHKFVDAIERSLKVSPVSEPTWINTQSTEHIAEVNRIRETALCALAKLAARVGSGAGDSSATGISSGLESLAAIMPPPPKEKHQVSGLASDALAGLGLGDDEPSSALVPVSGAGAVVPVNDSAHEKNVQQRIRNIIAKYRSSCDLETQLRACEYSVLLTPELAQVRQQALSRMPPINFEEIKERAAKRRDAALMDSAVSAPFSSDLLSLIDDAPPNKDPTLALPAGENDLSGLLGLPAPPVAKADSNDLNGLLGLGGASSTIASSSTAPPGGAMNLEDLMGGGNVAGVAASVNSVAPLDVLNENFAGMGIGRSKPNWVTLGETTWEPTETLSGKIVFSRNPEEPSITNATATFTNKTHNAVEGFSFGLAVPTGMSVEMQQASGYVVPASGMGEVTQLSIVKNPTHETKSIKLMYRVQWKEGERGELVTVKGRLTGLPAGL